MSGLRKGVQRVVFVGVIAIFSSAQLCEGGTSGRKITTEAGKNNAKKKIITNAPSRQMGLPEAELVYTGGNPSLQWAEISTTPPDGEIHYTSDGKEPSEKDPLIPSNHRIKLESQTILRFRATRKFYDSSDVMSMNLIPGSSQLQTVLMTYYGKNPPTSKFFQTPLRSWNAVFSLGQIVNADGFFGGLQVTVPKLEKTNGDPLYALVSSVRSPVDVTSLAQISSNHQNILFSITSVIYPNVPEDRRTGVWGYRGSGGDEQSFTPIEVAFNVSYHSAWVKIQLDSKNGAEPNVDGTFPALAEMKHEGDAESFVFILPERNGLGQTNMPGELIVRKSGTTVRSRRLSWPANVRDRVIVKDEAGRVINGTVDFRTENERRFTVVAASPAAKVEDVVFSLHLLHLNDRDTVGVPSTVRALPLPELLVDANRDGEIHGSHEGVPENKVDRTTSANPFRFWVNDDDDAGDTEGSDIPGQSPSVNQGYLGELEGADWRTLHDEGKVDGTRDLVDFFPVVLDLEKILEILPPDTHIRYLLKQEESALNFAYTELTAATAFEHLHKLSATGSLNDASDLAHAVTYWIKDTGYELDTTWLHKIKTENKGVILVEGRKATTKPLVLEILKDGQKLTEIKLYLSISGVEQMFRQKNLRDMISGVVGDDRDDAPVDSLGEPPNFPDNLSNSKWCVFVVGSNVSGQAARGWNSDMFKKLYWSGSKARFVGVSWFGDPYDDEGIHIPDLLYDYHMAVRNAFATAEPLKNFVNGLQGGKYIFGHSAGNIAVASALQDYGMTVNQFWMVDGAVAMEAFDGGFAKDYEGLASRAAHSDPTKATDSLWWIDANANPRYPTRLWASEWYQLFPSSDKRSTLTWRDRLSKSVSVTYNFYSSTEDVLGRYTGEFLGAIDNLANGGQYAWAIQEKYKGKQVNLGVLAGGSTYGGWGYNLSNDAYRASGGGNSHPKAPGDLPAISEEQLRTQSFFNNGEVPGNSYVGPTQWDVRQLFGSSGSALAFIHRNQLLAEFVPALTQPAGANNLAAVNGIEGNRNYNMPSQFATDVDKWPRPVTNGVPQWKHSHMSQIAYSHLYGLFDKFVQLGGLKND